MGLPYSLQKYFAQIRPIEECTAEDGRLIGDMLATKALRAPKRRRVQAIANFVSQTAMLREAPWAHLGTLL